MLTVYAFSRPDQEERQEPADQVQGPLPPQPLHPRPEGFRQGRQAQAEPAPWYVSIASVRWISLGSFHFARCYMNAVMNLC